MLRRLFESRQLLAVAIMPSGVCYLRFRPTIRGLKIETLIVHPFSKPVLSGAKIKDFSALAECLAMDISAIKSRGKVITCICATQVQIQTLQIPAVFSAGEIEEEIGAQLLRGIGRQRTELVVDFVQNGAGIGDSLETDIVAAKADYVSNLQTCFAQQGMSIHVLDIDLFALIRAAKFFLGRPVQAVGMVYIDNHYAVCAGWQHQNLLFHQAFERDAGDVDAWLHQVGKKFQSIELQEIVLFVPYECTESVREILFRYWSCDVASADYAGKLFGVSGDTADLMQRNPEVYVALGLALRGINHAI